MPSGLKTRQGVSVDWASRHVDIYNKDTSSRLGGIKTG